MAVFVILLGIALEIVKANAWFIVPDIAIYIVFAIGVALAIASIVSCIIAKRRFNSMSEKVNRYMRK